MPVSRPDCTDGGGAGFPRRVRLGGPAVFAEVFARPAKSSDRYFTVLARPNGLNHSRLGMAISRKIARSAVARNRIKRIVRESFRHHQSQLGGMDWVVMGSIFPVPDQKKKDALRIVGKLHTKLQDYYDQVR